MLLNTLKKKVFNVWTIFYNFYKNTNSISLSRETLVPIHSDGDGHCLVHAVSRAIVGRELFWHPLRTNLKQHFGQNLDKYRVCSI